MAKSSPTQSLSFLRWFLLLPIPIAWCAFHHLGALDFFENKSIDWRFQNRGELESEVKIVYVDVDSLSLDVIGNQPWSRDVYAKVAAALVNEAKIKAIGFDFVFSDTGIPARILTFNASRSGGLSGG